MDPERVATCGPGYETLEIIDASHFRIVASVGFGPFSSRATVEVEVTDAVPNERAVLSARGQATGTEIAGTAEMRLSGDPAGPTIMEWAADVGLDGTLGRMIEGTANRMIGQTFDCIRTRLAD
jgi:carbon monoxide dehydrogenase subunit G